jgi:hypothetical protein
VRPIVYLSEAFVTNIVQNPEALAISALAGSVHQPSVPNGAETVEQVDVLAVQANRNGVGHCRQRGSQSLQTVRVMIEFARVRAATDPGAGA